ncbi:MAG: SpoIIIAH-like family protein [Clostridia bacterium]|nr:SpoIIIAH-like family protein [Clostridia bacterium]
MAKFKIRGENGLLSKIGKKNILVVCAVLLLGGAICLNYFLFYQPGADIGYGDGNMTDDGGDASGAVVSDAYFSSTLLSRRQARDEALEVLQTVVDSEDALEATKDQALSDISRIALEIAQESDIEALVKAKGFEQCVAVISGENVSVIVKNEGELLPGQAAQISEIVYQQTGILPVNVKILCK